MTRVSGRRELIVTVDELLRLAAATVGGDRLDDYGDAQASHERIAALWSAFLGVEIAPWQVDVLMILMKCSRLATSPDKTDTWVDIAGYAALGGSNAGVV